MMLFTKMCIFSYLNVGILVSCFTHVKMLLDTLDEKLNVSWRVFSFNADVAYKLCKLRIGCGNEPP